MLDTLGGGSFFSTFDLFSGCTQLIIHPDTIPFTTFCTLTWPIVRAQPWPSSKKALRSKSPPPLRTPFAPFSRNLPHHRSLSSPTETRLMTDRDPSAIIATLDRLASLPPSSKNNVMAQYAPLFTSAERLSPTSRTGLLLNLKLNASSGALVV